MHSHSRVNFFLTLLCISILFLSFSPLQASTLEYLYINASEGNASGGHTALRFDQETFHFQHYPGSIIRLVKDPNIDFDYQYRYLENRTFYQATIDLPEKQFHNLYQKFNLQFLLQKQQNLILKEINLNITLLRQQFQSPLIRIKGAGLFDQARSNNTQTENRTIFQLQQAINQAYGDNFLENEIQKLQLYIAFLQPQPWTKNSLQLNEHSFASVPYSFVSQHLDTAAKLLLLKTIVNNSSLNKQYYFSPEHSAFTLSQQERDQLKIFQKTLMTHFIALLNSSRPDWGHSGFVLYARILTLSLAIKSGHFVFLDNYVDDAQTIPYSKVQNNKALFQAQSKHALTQFNLEKARLVSPQHPMGEQQYSKLELFGNYYFERERSLLTKHSLRISGQQRLADKSIQLPTQLIPQLNSQQTKSALQRLIHYKNLHWQQLKSLYHYDLFTRNCVTEIFDLINKSIVPHKQLSKLHPLTPKEFSTFIPFAAYDWLPENYRRDLLPSFRQLQVAEMYKNENPSVVFFRESNTLSARHYKYNDQDSIFLFFTDDVLLLRPFFGTANLLTAATISLYGIFTLPLDSGKTLMNGAMGILMSLPELAFFNIRKGSYEYLLPPEQIE